jgi:hypothetical protein
MSKWCHSGAKLQFFIFSPAISYENSLEPMTTTSTSGDVPTCMMHPTSIFYHRGQSTFGRDTSIQIGHYAPSIQPHWTGNATSPPSIPASQLPLSAFGDQVIPQNPEPTAKATSESTNYPDPDPIPFQFHYTYNSFLNQSSEPDSRHVRHALDPAIREAGNVIDKMGIQQQKERAGPQGQWKS